MWKKRPIWLGQEEICKNLSTKLVSQTRTSSNFRFFQYAQAKLVKQKQQPTEHPPTRHWMSLEKSLRTEQKAVLAYEICKLLLE
ncbi:hypothetical protein T4B_304 [Trichinella pseudospiralis]|uniref:Uncharacterized protein n=2 Tax=Trichinella pseudospiralis TaxID=6337 RepID=A0A0V1IM86_TRIPS|nr:hypothetical protein T4E_11378 [Trichinella pseudospiralis]KRX88606.1 hypothetical protein T4E_5465 [Trichinella pseudospiralis]KRY85590.1 hypothetical protein T4D_8279 [Trichinella pseudospiralis]KRZ23741.1 hypothetical protein T4B_304 [Trichinella pseudospiralis]